MFSSDNRSTGNVSKSTRGMEIVQSLLEILATARPTTTASNVTHSRDRVGHAERFRSLEQYEIVNWSVESEEFRQESFLGIDVACGNPEGRY